MLVFWGGVYEEIVFVRRVDCMGKWGVGFEGGTPEYFMDYE